MLKIIVWPFAYLYTQFVIVKNLTPEQALRIRSAKTDEERDAIALQVVSELSPKLFALSQRES